MTKLINVGCVSTIFSTSVMTCLCVPCIIVVSSAMKRLSGVALLVTISVCLSLTIVCHIIALSTHHWIESSSSSDFTETSAEQGTLLRLGLWTACFSNYRHRHEPPENRYDGCHSLYSDYYANIRLWLIPRRPTYCSI